MAAQTVQITKETEQTGLAVPFFLTRMRDRFGENSVSLATGMKGRFRERVHENPAGLPGKTPGEE